MSKLFFLAVALWATDAISNAQTVKRAAPITAANTKILFSTRATFRPGDSFEMNLGAVPAASGDAQNFNKTYTVGGDGTINVPYAGVIRAAGLTQSQLEKTVQQRLIDEKIFRWPTITINVRERARFITVGGRVRAPQRILFEEMKRSDEMNRFEEMNQFEEMKRFDEMKRRANCASVTL